MHPKPKNCLAIDYGSRHTGIAISLNNSLPLALTTISNSSQKEVIEKIRDLTRKEAIDVIILGLPQSQTHSPKQIEEILDFKKLLEKAIPEMVVKTFDEKMTSKMAARYSSKEKEHQEAARIILEDWLNKKAAK